MFKGSQKSSTQKEIKNTFIAKEIEVTGNFKGKGSVEGEITVKNIKTHEGGKLIGSMRIYVDKTETSLFTEIGQG